MDYDTTLQKLDEEIEQLLAAEAEVDTEIEELLKEEDCRIRPRRFTTFELFNEPLIEPWSDPAELPKRTTTHDIVSQHLRIEWSDPANLPKSKTTFDAAVAELTQEHPPVEVGSLQVVGGATYRFDDTHQWVLVQ